MVLLRFTTLRSVLALLLLLLMLPLLPATPVGAATPAITVTSNADSGLNTLRQAIADIDAGGTITFAAGLGPITLASPISITKAMTITGNGPADTIIQGGPDPRPPSNGPSWLLSVGAASGTVAFTAMTLRNYYGGILGGTVTTVKNVTFSGFTYDGIDQGGFVTDQTTDTVTGSTFSNNFVGIRHKGGSPISGGAAGRSLSVTDTTFSSNDTGLGIYTQSSQPSSVTVTNTAFTGNKIGLDNAPGGPQSLSVTDSTFSGNTVVGFDNEPDTGNSSITQPTTVTSTTIANNGTGLVNKPGLSEPLTITGSIVSGNSTNCQTVAPGTTTDGGYNLEYGTGAPANTCPFAANAVHADPLLGPLQDNGGTTTPHTLTQALASASPAINAGGTIGTDCPTTDQRGFTRVGQCDIGAYEFIVTATRFAVTGYPSPTTAGESHAVTVTATDGSGNVATTYSGTVTVTTSDPQATIQAAHTLTNGVGTFTVTFRTGGTQSITATGPAPSGGGTITGSETGITVIATPMSKDACKDGGWQRLTDANGQPFKNQGQCVSYFNHQ